MYVTLPVSFGFRKRFERIIRNTRTLIAITHFIHWGGKHCYMRDLKIKKSKNILQRQHSA